LISGTSGKDGRAVALRASDSSIRLDSSRVEAGKSDPERRTSFAVAVDARGGNLRLIRSVVAASAAESATGISAKGLSVDASGTDVSGAAEGYASAVSVEGGATVIAGGALSASARDAAVLILNDSRPSSFDAVQFSVRGSGVVRAVQVRGPFPSISACGFSAEETSAGSEVLAGDPPLSGSVRGNRFSGFAFLYDQTFSADYLFVFNRRFAGKGPANEIISIGGK
jgi:hypothetical protein